MEYKGVRYQILARPGKNKWRWTVYLGVAKSKNGETSGPRQRAVIAARAAIDLWLRQNPSAELKTSKTEKLPDDVAPALRPGFLLSGTTMTNEAQSDKRLSVFHLSVVARCRECLLRSIADLRPTMP